MKYLTCDEYDGTNSPDHTIDLRSYFVDVIRNFAKARLGTLEKLFFVIYRSTSQPPTRPSSSLNHLYPLTVSAL